MIAMPGQFVLALGSLCVGTVLAQGAGMPLIIPEKDYIVDTRCDVLVATIKGVSKHAATRARPPVVEIRIEETLRGEPFETRKCTWEYPYDPAAYSPDGPPPTPEQQRQHEAYARQPLEPPKVDSKWILLGAVWEYSSPISFIPSYKYPYSEEKVESARAEIERAKQLTAQRQEYQGQWPESPGLPGSLLRKDSRPVDADTPLKKGQPILDVVGPSVGQLWQCRVIETLEDGRVRVRPTGYDSRADRVEPRQRLRLYPRKWLRPPKQFRARYSSEQIERFASLADIVAVGKVSSGPGIHGNSELYTYTFQVGDVLKGDEEPEWVKVWVPLRTSILLLPRDKSYILFLRRRESKTSFFKRIVEGDGFVEFDDDTLRTVRSGISR
jgi:hypothetical protein